MRSMVEGPLHRTSCGPQYRVDRAPGTIWDCWEQSHPALLQMQGRNLASGALPVAPLQHLPPCVGGDADEPVVRVGGEGFV
jgi:hypothetical protein